MSSSVAKIDNKPVSTINKSDFLDIFGVRITPPYLEFRQAFEGKTYKQKLSIQNIGKSKVVIRITPPTSYAYNIKPVRAHDLSPGLTLVRDVSLVFSYANSPSSILSIYINENRHDYELYATGSFPDVSVSPQCIDFGLIDTGHPSATHTMVLKNDGNALTRFYIDTTTSSEYTVIVEPIKGMLQARSSYIVTVRLLSHVEGNVTIDLWVKTSYASLVVVKGESITARFEPIISGLPSTFTLLDFPVTYVGLTSTQTIYIRNFSAVPTMFCMLGEIDREVLTLDACRELQIDYNFFTSLPKSGTFQPKEIQAIRFKFEPKKLKPSHKQMRFYFCTFHIYRIRSRFLTAEDYHDLFGHETNTYDEHSICDWSSSLLTQEYSSNNRSTMFKKCVTEAPNIIRPVEQTKCVKIHLHGMSETPQVTVVPDELSLADLIIGQRESRVLELQNKSVNLPIILVYKKVAYINLDKVDIYIRPNSSVQVSVNITPQKIGTTNSQIEFDLVFYDYPKTDDEYKTLGKLTVPVKFTVKALTRTPLPQINTGITPNYVKEVGKFCHDLKFNKQVQKPKTAIVAGHLISKSSSALICLPNDTQNSLRPWRDKSKCKTLFTKVSRYVPPINSDYELTVFDKRVKIEASNYYTNYIRQEAKRLKFSVATKKTISEYDIAERAKRLCTNYKMTPVEPVTSSKRPTTSQYLPLLINPVQIVNIIIDPMVVNTGPIAASHKYEFTMKIKNKNSIPISINMKPDKTNILFPEGNHKMVKPNSQIVFPVIYISPSIVGFHSTEVKLVLNERAYIIIDVIADVCQPNLKLSTNVVVFADETTRRYVEISNQLGSDISFKWNLSCHNFDIEPKEGICKGSNSLLCYVEYFPNKIGPLVADLDFFCAKRHVNQLRLIAKRTDKKLRFVPERLRFHDAPLNIPVAQKVMLQNDSPVLQHYSLKPSEFDKWVDIFPKEGVVYPASYAVVTVTVTQTTGGTFSSKLTFDITRSGEADLILEGNVAYPEVTISPSMLHFNKIPCSTTSTLKFTIENNSNAVASISFNMSMYPEYVITKTNKFGDTSMVDTFTLAKHTHQTLYARFKPYAVCRDKFLLPIIVNKQLAVDIREAESKHAVSFFKERLSLRKSFNIHPPISNPISVNSYATEAKIIFSKFVIYLTYSLPPGKYESTYRLKISNPQPEREKICIRTDYLDHPFHLTYVSGKEITELEDSLICSLNPHEEVYLEVSFRPDTFGTYKVVLPVFLKSDNSDKPHNILFIEGVFAKPTIMFRHPVYYTKPVPLKISVIRCTTLILKHHFQGCQVYPISPVPWLEVNVMKRTSLANNVQEVLIKGRFCPEVRTSLYITVSVRCSCGGECDVPVYVTVDNCFLTNYAFVHNFIMSPQYNLELKSTSVVMQQPSALSTMDVTHGKIEEYNLSEFLLSYPLFPEENDNMYKFMESCVSVMETWVYNQGFFGSSFYKIPEGIAHVEFVSDKQKTKITVVSPFVKLLINILGEEMEKYFEIEIILKCTHVDIESVYLLYNLYKKIINFLEEEGAQFNCACPEYLMPFENYILFMENLSNELNTRKILNITDFSEFYRVSKQAWLEMLMQTYKVLILSRALISTETYKSPLENEKNSDARYRHSVKYISAYSHLFSTIELLLLNWMTFHYKDVRKMYWADNSYLQEKEVSYFGEHMEDGFIYAAITLTYCPFFDEHFKKLRPCPLSIEERLHNNIKVMQSWDVLNLNTGSTALDLLNPHPLRTLLTIVYLYQVLPQMCSTEFLDFNAGLSLRQSKTLTLTNDNHFAVAYKAILYGNDDGCFRIGKTFYIIQPKRKCKITLEYWAKFVKSSRCTLILSGECKGYRYATNKVIALNGEPDFSYVTQNFDLTGELYKVRDTTLSILSPYAVTTSYKIQYTNVATLTSEDIESAPYRCDFPTFCVVTCVPMDSTLKCNENGEGEMRFCTLPFATKTIPTWIILRNAEVGDFSIKIKTRGKVLRRQELLEVELSPSFLESDYATRMEYELFLEIPCQNRILWKAIIEMLLKFAESDIELWKDVIHTTAGMHALQRLISICSGTWSGELRIKEPSDFDIVVDKDCHVILPDTVHIEDKCYSGSVKVPLKYLQKKNPQNFSIVLKSTNDQEIRQYRVCFVRASKSDLFSSTNAVL